MAELGHTEWMGSWVHSLAVLHTLRRDLDLADKLVVELGLLLLELHMSCRRGLEQVHRMIMRQPARVDHRMVLLVLVHYTLEQVLVRHMLERVPRERLAELVQVLVVEGVYMSLLLQLGLLGTVSLPVEEMFKF